MLQAFDIGINTTYGTLLDLITHEIQSLKQMQVDVTLHKEDFLSSLHQQESTEMNKRKSIVARQMKHSDMQ